MANLIFAFGFVYMIQGDFFELDFEGNKKSHLVSILHILDGFDSILALQ